MSPTFALLQSRFGNRLLIRPVEAGLVLGIAEKTTYNHITSGTLPFPLVKGIRGHAVRLSDLADYIDGLRIINK